MNFISSGSVAEEDDLANIEFWGALKMSEFRDAMRVDSVVTASRAKHCLAIAVLDVNTQLRAWQLQQEANGHSTAANVPPRPEHPEGAWQQLYFRAVWSTAMATLIERYRSYDTTNSGQGRADEQTATVDDYRRDAAWAINDIKGTHRNTVELI